MASLPSETSDPQPRGRVATALFGSFLFVAVLWGIEIVDSLFQGRLEGFGIRPLSVEGLFGILFAPLLHSNWQHLVANTGPSFVLSFMILLGGTQLWLRATAIIWVVAGVGTWLLGGAGTVHIGASALVFGWITYLMLRGFFTKKFLQILVGILILLMYGGVLWGIFPTAPGVSWQGHLFGAIGGVLAAMAGRNPQNSLSR